MLATILKAIGISFLLFIAFVCYALMRAASMADEYEGFEDYYWGEK